MNMRKIRKKWRSANTHGARMKIISSWMGLAMNEIGLMESHPLGVLAKLNAESLLFTEKPISENVDPYFEVSFSDNWFQTMIAQVLGDKKKELTELIYHKLHWDYEAARNPKPTPNSVLEQFDLHDVATGGVDIVVFQLENRNAVPVGSVWISEKGAEWDVIANIKGRCEILSIWGTFYRDEDDMMKTFKRIS